MSLRTLLALILSPYLALGLEVVIMDYSDLDYSTINVYTYEKESESQESENNVYMQDDPEEEYVPVQEYHFPYIFRLYDYMKKNLVVIIKTIRIMIYIW